MKGAVDMYDQLSNELDDFRRRDGDDHDEPATPVRRVEAKTYIWGCLLYTSDAADE